MTSRKPRISSTNEDYGPLSEIDKEFVRDMVLNEARSRSAFFEKFNSPRVNIDAECGYPEADTYTPQMFRALYDTENIPARVVQLMPYECWQSQPRICESDDPKVQTTFEKEFLKIGENIDGESWFEDTMHNPIWEYFKRADELCGIGYFGLMVFGIDDNLPWWKPAAGVGFGPSGVPFMTDSSPVGTDAQYNENFGEYDDDMKPAPRPSSRNLTSIRVFDQTQVQITRYERDIRNPRYGYPIEYLVTMHDPRLQQSGIGVVNQMVRCHWSRCVHLVDNLGSNNQFSYPRQQQVLKRLLDLRKLYGGSAEMYWKGALPGLSIETNPQLGSDVVIDRKQVRGDMQAYMNGLQRYLALQGMTAKTLAPQVVDPTPQINAQLNGICIKLACPMRVFMGSERGELASSQDDASWNDRLSSRQVTHLNPRLVAPATNRLIQMGVLPQPKKFKADWPDLNAMTDQDKATIGLTRTQALAAYVSGNVEALVQPLAQFTTIMGIDEEEAESMLNDTLAAGATDDENRLTPDPTSPPQLPVDSQGNDVYPTGTDPNAPPEEDDTKVPIANLKTMVANDWAKWNQTHKRLSGRAIKSSQNAKTSQQHEVAAKNHMAAAKAHQASGNTQAAKNHTQAAKSHKSLAEFHKTSDRQDIKEKHHGSSKAVMATAMRQKKLHDDAMSLAAKHMASKSDSKKKAQSQVNTHLAAAKDAIKHGKDAKGHIKNAITAAANYSKDRAKKHEAVAKAFAKAGNHKAAAHFQARADFHHKHAASLESKKIVTNSKELFTTSKDELGFVTNQMKTKVTANFNTGEKRDKRGRWTRSGYTSMQATGHSSYLGSLKEVQSLGGSTGAKLVESPTGKKYVLKKGTTPEHLTAEFHAERAYQALGVKVPGSRFFSSRDSQPVKLSRYIPGTKTLGQTTGVEHDLAVKQIKKHFAAHALLANWDVIGLSKDNVLVKPNQNGPGVKTYHIDAGGALDFRASGKKKGQAWNGQLSEWHSMRSGSNPQSNSVFGGMTSAELKASAAHALSHKDALLKALPVQYHEVMNQRLAKLQEIHDSIHVETSQTTVKTPRVPKTPVVAPVTATTSHNTNAEHVALMHTLKTKGGKKFNEEHLAKFAIVNPHGIHNNTVYVPMAVAHQKGKVEHLKSILPEGTQLKSINTSKFIKDKGLLEEHGHIVKSDEAKYKKGKMDSGEGMSFGSKTTPKPIAARVTPSSDAADQSHVVLKTSQFHGTEKVDITSYPEPVQKWVHGLTDNEKGAISSWKGDPTTIRKDFAKNPPPPPPQIYAKGIYTAIAKAPSVQGIMYRGLHGTYVETLMTHLQKEGVGGTFSDTSPMGLSTSKGVSHKFSNGQLMLKLTQKTARSIKPVSGFAHEAEALSMPNTQYRIKAIHSHNDVAASHHVKHFVELEEI